MTDVLEPHTPIHRPWSPAEDETIRTYANAGASAGRCARYIGRTRNAVLGRAHRIGVHFTDPLNRSKPVPTKHPDPVRVGQHKPWVNQNMSATVPVHHDRGLDDDE